MKPRTEATVSAVVGARKEDVATVCEVARGRSTGSSKVILCYIKNLESA